MKLFLNGIELDASQEHELIADNEFGFDVDIVYEHDIMVNTNSGERDMYKEVGYFQHFNNCTEVHHRYERSLPFDVDKIAFESDIHCTGCTRDIKHLKFVHVRNATVKSDNY